MSSQLWERSLRLGRTILFQQVSADSYPTTLDPEMVSRRTVRIRTSKSEASSFCSHTPLWSQVPTLWLVRNTSHHQDRTSSSRPLRWQHQKQPAQQRSTTLSQLPLPHSELGSSKWEEASCSQENSHPAEHFCQMPWRVSQSLFWIERSSH